MSLLDYMLGGLSTFSVSSSNVTLSYTLGGGGDVTNALWRFTGTLLASITVSPAAGNATTYLTGSYAWENLTTGSFTITVSTGTGAVVLPQGRRGTIFFDATNAPRITSIAGSGTADPIPTASAVMFYNIAAPSGWTALAVNDFAVKIVSNNTTGGSGAGSVNYSTLFGRTGTDPVTLAQNNLPPHTHAFTFNQAGGFTFTGATTAVTTILQTGGGNAVGTQNGPGTSASFTPAIDMRVLTAAFVLASRN